MSLQTLFTFFGGLGLFLFGMNEMADGLQKVAGNKMKSLLEALTKNKFMGVIVGAVVTAIVQSSSATTVMVVGFVNAGLMNLKQSVGIIMGANIGTTVTSWVVSMGEWSKFLKPDFLAPIAVAIGAFMILFIKNPKIKQRGEIFIGFGLLFLGLNQMSSSMSFLKNSESFKQILVSFSNNPIMGILAGAFVTAVIQSSSASVAILQTITKEGLVPFSSAVYIIMGQNIGTCITALMSSTGASKNAKSAAYVHLLFNVIGSAVISIFAILYFKLFNQALAASIISQTQISLVHTAFNISNTLLLYRFSDNLIAIAEKLTKNIKEEKEDELIVIHLDDRILDTPAFAIQNTIKEMVNFGRYALESLRLSRVAFLNKDEKVIEEIFKREKNIDVHEQLIVNYLLKITADKTTPEESNVIAKLFKAANDIERIGDHCENLAELSKDAFENNIEFSKLAEDELNEIFDLSAECLALSLESLEKNDISLAKSTLEVENRIDDLEKLLRDSHLKRLMKDECNTQAGILFLEALSNLERVGDHSFNITELVLK